MGQIAKASTHAQLVHTVQEPARTVNIVSGLQNSSLLSISKFAYAGYNTVFTAWEVQIFNGNNMNLVSTKKPIFQEWRDQTTGLW